MLLAIGVAVISCIQGVYLSFYLDASTGGCIVAVQALIFFGVVLLAPRRGLLVRARQRRSVRLSSAQLRPAAEA